jgi:hypothetical protein
VSRALKCELLAQVVSRYQRASRIQKSVIHDVTQSHSNDHTGQAKPSHWLTTN